MSNIDKRALREAAEKATPGPWEMEQENIWFTDAEGYTKHLIYVQQGDDVDDKQDHYNTAFIAAANPETALALLDEMEADKEQIKTLESRNRRLEGIIDAAEKRIAELEARTLSQAATDVLAERRSQITAEGWTPEHDDKYRHSEMLWAACCYVLNTIQKYNRVPFDWPWRDEWWKPTNQRRDLVKANALLLAEIERIDRSADAGKGE